MTENLPDQKVMISPGEKFILATTRTEKSKQTIFYVYVLLDNRKPGNFKYGDFNFSYEPFYVGKGHDDRFAFHEAVSLNTANQKHLYNKIRKIIRETGESILVEFPYTMLNEDNAFKQEKELIKVIGRYDLNLGPLLNKTDGGDGCSGLVVSDETKLKHSERMKIWNTTMEPDYREKFLKAVSDGVKKAHSNRSDEEREEYIKSISDGLNSRDLESKSTWAENISNSNKKYWENMSDEDKENWLEKKKLGELAIPKEVKEEMNRKRSIASKKMHEIRSDEETQRLKTSWSESRKKFWANKTPEERAVIAEKQRETKRRKKLLKEEKNDEPKI